MQRQEVTIDAGLGAGEPLGAALAHEVNPPLTAILSNCEGGALSLARIQPNLAEVRALARISCWRTIVRRGSLPGPRLLEGRDKIRAGESTALGSMTIRAIR